MSLKYFTDAEVAGLDNRLALLLDQVRELSHVPIIITRGKSTPEGNAGAGGVDGSAHLGGLAVDVACSTSGIRLLLVKAFLAVGFVRIGVYDKHIHVDIDETKPQSVMWLGTSH